jgi:hypothetical protein
VLFLGAAVLGPLTVAAAEAAQRRVLASRQNAETARELAFDDALRVQATLAVMLVPWVVCVSLAIALAAPLARFGTWSGAAPTAAVLDFSLVPNALLILVTRAKWVNRYYLRRMATYSDFESPTDDSLGAVC